jgi:small conductance mechanosensitive channel
MPLLVNGLIVVYALLLVLTSVSGSSMQEEIKQAQALYDTLIEFAVTYSFQLAGALVILLIGWWIAAKIGSVVENMMVGRNIDVTLSRFTGGASKLIVLGLVIIIALGNIGISVTPLIAAVGAVGLGAGLAIQGMLANYAAGFTIIITRPFVVGDTIQVCGVAGVVDKVMLPYTLLINEDNVSIQIPNKLIVGEILHNSAAQMLIELEIGVAYSSNIEQVTEVIAEAVKTVSGLSEDKAPAIGVDSFGDSSINFGVRVWADPNRHFEIRYAINAAIFAALQQAKVDIPFPQREVRML